MSYGDTRNYKLAAPANSSSLSTVPRLSSTPKMIDETKLCDKNGIMTVPENSLCDIEKPERLNMNHNQKEETTVERNELAFRFCRQPKSRSDTINLTILSSETLGQLKEKVRKMVVNQETHNLYLLTKNEWSMFGLSLDGQLLDELGFKTDSIISFGTKYDPIPGVCGLTNLGNTCFMNSALQCLSNVPQFAEQILSFDEKMNAPVIGAYVNLIKTIWSGEYTNTKPSSLLINIREDLPRFTKYRQHDAQEFMSYFLHLIHQELTNEDTLITRLFHGQIQSSIKCLECGFIETNVETISFLPLPMDNDFLEYNILYLKKSGEQHSISVRADAKTIDVLIESFIRQYDLQISPAEIKPVKIVDNYIIREYSSSTYINDGIRSDLAFIEVPEKTTDQKHLELKFIDQTTGKPFRPPLFLVGPSFRCRYSDIVEQINQIRNHFRYITNNGPTSTFHLHLINTNREYIDLSTGNNMSELLYSSDELVMGMNSQYASFYKNRYNTTNKSRDTSLNTLLTDFFREELLDGDYYCSKCQNLKKAKQKADFTLPLPPVLIIQLKRFPYDVHSIDKINTFIDFPLNNLDLNNYIAPEALKNGKMSALYDLVAVSNHTGTLTCGHYTTYAKNYRNNKWYSFNDDLTQEIHDERDVVTRNAYILVYVRRSPS